MESSPNLVVFTAPKRAACREICLVLQAIGVPFELLHRHDVSAGEPWSVAVPSRFHAKAVREIEEYLRDKETESLSPETRVPVFGGAIMGVLFYVSVMISVAILADVSAYGIDWQTAGHMRAGDVMSGQVWRTVTALTLHADASHLISNLMFGGVFGLLVGRILGGGVAWLAIVVGGGLGNFGNAVLREADHVSIGASTAVFAMLGILVAHALRPRGTVPPSVMQRWSPLIAGVLMLAFIGLEGERTDVLAHTSGFTAGVLVGAAACRFADKVLESKSVQFFASAAAVAILSGAWILAT